MKLLLLLGVLCASYAAAAPSYVGSLDVADCNHVSGWAGDQAVINKTVKVNLYVDGKLSKSVTSNLPRKDVADAGYGPNHGFEITLPATAKNGVAHSFAVRVTGAGVELWGSPRSLTCAKPTPTPRPSPTPKPSPSPSATPKPSPSPSVSPSPSASPSPTATASPTATPAPTATVSVTVRWNANRETNIAGYRVLAGKESGQYSQTTDVPGTGTTATVKVGAGIPWYFAVTAYNEMGAESVPSTEASYQP